MILSFHLSVKTVGDNSTAQKLYVTTGEVQDGKIIITEGLKGDEKLISEGARMVVNNEVVEIKG